MSNEPVLSYKRGSKERAELEKALDKYDTRCVDVPIVIGDEEIYTADVRYQVQPFNHKKKVARFSYATPDLVRKAIAVSVNARAAWDRTPFEERCKIFLHAADLMQNKYRMDLVAATMLGQAKTIVQAEIDATCELIDFLTHNVQFARDIQSYQPKSAPPGEFNRMVYRGLEGFWASISPFNFTAIGGNLAATPALMGNVVLWKPSDASILSNYTVYRIFREAGLPPGIINFIPVDGPVFGDTVAQSPLLAGINFTGSVPTFEYLWKKVAENISNYLSFPRLIGECGGKNFHLVHESADVETVANGTLRAAFEYSGQKCSACSRLYIPKSLWPRVRDRMLFELGRMKVGSPLQHDVFMSAVIDEKSFNRNAKHLELVKSSKDCKVIAGGKANGQVGYFVEPTIVEVTNPKSKLLQEEIFGPILGVYPYSNEEAKNIVELLNSGSPYGLTGAIFATDKAVLADWTNQLRDVAGNFYINDKCTGAVVGRQPFGGARKSGTNDKAGGPHYLMRFVSPQAIKETHKPLTEWAYPHME